MEDTTELKNILEKKFKRMMGSILNEFEVNYNTVIKSDESTWNSTRRNIIALTYKVIHNMKKDVDKLYGHKYHIRLIPDRDGYGNIL